MELGLYITTQTYGNWTSNTNIGCEWARADIVLPMGSTCVHLGYNGSHGLSWAACVHIGPHESTRVHMGMHGITWVSTGPPDRSRMGLNGPHGSHGSSLVLIWGSSGSVPWVTWVQCTGGWIMGIIGAQEQMGPYNCWWCIPVKTDSLLWVLYFSSPWGCSSNVVF